MLRIKTDKRFGFVAIHVATGREVARSHSRALLQSYVDECHRLSGVAS